MGKRKVEHEKEANHERWLVSYADFITLLFATFVALYAMSQSDSAKEKEMAGWMRHFFGSGETQMIPQESFNFQQVPSETPNQSISEDGTLPSSPQQANRNEFEAIKNSLEQFLMTKGMLGKVNVTLEERGLVVSLKESGFFESGRADIKEASYQIFAELAAHFGKYRNPLRVEGHTDNVPIRSRSYPSNWELSTARATNVLRLLVRRYKIAPDKISATGYGEFRPMNNNNTSAGRGRNRRVDIVILSPTGEKAEPMAL